jgi:hypothetical protein
MPAAPPARSTTFFPLKSRNAEILDCRRYRPFPSIFVATFVAALSLAARAFLHPTGSLPHGDSAICASRFQSERPEVLLMLGAFLKFDVWNVLWCFLPAATTPLSFCNGIFSNGWKLFPVLNVSQNVASNAQWNRFESF